MKNTLWVDAYNPKKIDDYLWYDKKQLELVSGWVKQKDIPHLLLSGDPGTGKTSLVKLLKSELKCSDYNFFEINGSKVRDKDDLQKILDESTKYICGAWGGDAGGYSKLIVLIDECDQLKEASMKMLRGEIEATQNHVRWCFTCNDTKKIPAPILSRVTHLKYSKLQLNIFTAHMQYILDNEKIDYTPKLLKAYANRYYSDVRKCISELQNNTIDGKLN